jgi:hypothetical protein
VGYTVLDVAGSIVAPRTTTGVYELASGSGLYAANVAWPDAFNGQILWDCPGLTGSSGFILAQAFATEQYNFEANDPMIATVVSSSYALLSGTLAPSIQGLVDVAFGRWKINKATNQMLFYREDNVTLVATFNLYDDTGAPAYDGVFERQLVGPVTP